MRVTHCPLSVQVGDGTTSVTLLAAEFLKQVKPYVEEGLHPQIIIRAFRTATQLVRHGGTALCHPTGTLPGKCQWEWAWGVPCHLLLPVCTSAMLPLPLGIFPRKKG